MVTVRRKTAKNIGGGNFLKKHKPGRGDSGTATRAGKPADAKAGRGLRGKSEKLPPWST